MTTQDPDALFSMRVVARMTGLSAHTIRKWEQRYSAVRPSRTEGNTRKFSTADVRRLNLLAALTKRGHGIRELAPLPEAQLQKLLGQACVPKTSPDAPDDHEAWNGLRQDYLNAVRRFDAQQASDILSQPAALLNPLDFIHRIVVPLLTEVGLLWSEGQISPSHEHLATGQIRSLLSAMFRWNLPQPGAPRVVVSTPEGHLHELGAMIGAILAAHRGFEPIYLGPSLPAADMRIALELSRAHLLLLSVVRDGGPTESKRLADDLRMLSTIAETWVGLPAGHPLVGRDSGVRFFHRFEDLDLALTQFGVSGKM